MSNSERYVFVTGKLVRKNRNSFIFENEEGDEVVIGRSCIHGIDEQAIADAVDGDEIEFRLMAWLADKESMKRS